MGKIFIIIGISICLFSCSENNCNSPSLSCNENLVIVSTEVQNTTGEHIELDSTHTQNSSVGIIYKYMNSSNEDVLFYTVVTDSEEPFIAFKGTSLLFRGWKDGNLVVDQEFIVGKDCCHIEKIDGPEVITVL